MGRVGVLALILFHIKGLFAEQSMIFSANILQMAINYKKKVTQVVA